ncbi:MAG: DUF333 domain-containing protein [Halobacteriovoraceae bacterium]|jgi:hypothetical protein|nr:DUF333 domain-containing protein [Halobacteriovoraceae bacterium]
MNILLMLTLLTISNQSIAEDLFLNMTGKVITIKIRQLKKVKVNQSCYESKDNCMALKALNIPKKKSIARKLAGHPASLNCQRVQGNSIILQDKMKNEFDYCAFSDKSMVNSWDLLNSSGSNK